MSENNKKERKAEAAKKDSGDSSKKVRPSLFWRDILWLLGLLVVMCIWISVQSNEPNSKNQNLSSSQVPIVTPKEAVSCTTMRGKTYQELVKLVDNTGTFLYSCLKAGEIKNIKGIVSNLSPNIDADAKERGRALESFNLWYAANEGFGMRVANYTKDPISKIIVGYKNEACSHPIGQDEPFEKTITIEVPSSNPINPNTEVMLQWDVPSDISVSHDSCMDILSAFPPTQGEVSSADAQPSNGACLSDGDIVTLQGTATAKTLTATDGSANTVWIFNTSTPICVVEGANKLGVGTAGLTQKNISEIQIIGVAPPPDTAIELKGTLSTGNVTQYYYVSTAIKVISGKRISNTSASASPDAAIILNAISNQAQPHNEIISKSASFDCNKAQSTLEKLICTDANLSSLDGMVGDAYSQARSNATQDSAAREKIIDDQRQFLKGRLGACPIPVQPVLSEAETQKIIGCLKEQYTLRLQVLTDGKSSSQGTGATKKPLNLDDKHVFSDAMSEVMNTFQVTGVSGVSIEIEDCYKYVNEGVPSKGLLYCIAMDADASNMFSAIEASHNFPPTPEFIYSTYQARVRRNLEAAGFVDPNEQQNIIQAVESKVKAGDINQDNSSMNANKPIQKNDQYQFNQ